MTQNPQMTRILVLGANGRLGRLLRAAWKTNPPENTKIHLQSRQDLPGSNSVTWAPGQPTAPLPDCKTVIALWGQTSGDAASLVLNTDLAHETRRVAQACGATRVLHFSTAAVYGPAQDAAENTPLAPVNAYGLSKVAMEQVVQGFAGDSARHCCLRLANVVGADSLAPALRRTDPVQLDRFANGLGPERSYIGAGDLAQVLIGLAHLPLTHSPLTHLPGAQIPSLLNITAPQPLAMHDLARAAARDILWQEAPPGAVQRVTLNGARLGQLLPHINLLTQAAPLIAQWQQLELSLIHI